MARPTKWIGLFTRFAKELRIASKEVSSADSEGAPFKMWDSQKLFLTNLADGLEDGVRTFVTLKSRQVGITTVSLAIDVFWMAMFRNTIGALVTDTEVNRDANRHLISAYIKSLPDGYFGESFRILHNNNKFISFSNGSRLDLLVAGTRKKPAWGEGRGYSYAHLTEVASYGDAEGLRSFIEALAQTNPDRLFVFESTAKGFANLWYSIWEDAKKDALTKRAFFIGWWASPANRIEQRDPRFSRFDHELTGEEAARVNAVEQQYGHRISIEQLVWYRWRESQTAGDVQSLNQNQPWTEQEAFVLTGYSFFPTRVLTKEMETLHERNHQFHGYRYEMGNDFWSVVLDWIKDGSQLKRVQLRVWEEPLEHGRYVIGFDPAWGRTEHKDRSAISVWRCYADRLVQVAEFASAEVEVKQAAWVCAHLAGVYRDCMVNIELGGPGRTIMDEWEHLKQMCRAEAFQKSIEGLPWEDFLSYARWYLYHRPDSFGAGYAANFETTNRTKWELMHGMKGSLITNELEIKSIHLLREMQIVVQDGNEIGAPESRSEDCKDDRVFAAALAIRAWVNWRRPELIARGETFEMVSKEESGELPQMARSINGIVQRFFQKKFDAEEAGPPPDWREARGLR